MIGLRACRVDLTSHFLGDETKLLSRIRLIVQCVEEITAMLTETDLLLIDVKLLDVEDHLLLKAALVRLCLKLGKTAQNFFPDGLCALLLILLHLCRILQDIVDLFSHILVQDLSLLCPESIDVTESLVNACLYNRPVIICDHILLLRIHNLRHTENHSKQVVRVLAPKIVCSQPASECIDLLIILHRQIHVYLLRAVGGIRLEGDEEIDVSACQLVGDLMTHSNLLILRKH